MSSEGPFQPILVCDQEGHIRTCTRCILYLTFKYRHHHGGTLFCGSQYKYCRGYLLIKMNSLLLLCFPRVTTQSSWNKIGVPILSTSRWLACEPTATASCIPIACAPYKGGVQMAEPSSPALAHFRWLCYPKWPEPGLQSKDRRRYQPLSPPKPWPKPISLSILTIRANCFVSSQVGPYSLSLLEVQWGLIVELKKKKKKLF